MNRKEKDLFAKWEEIALLKLERAGRFPELFDFLKEAAFEDAPEVKPEVERRNKKVTNNAYAQLIDDIDTSKFKEGI